MQSTEADVTKKPKGESVTLQDLTDFELEACISALDPAPPALFEELCRRENERTYSRTLRWLHVTTRRSC